MRARRIQREIEIIKKDRDDLAARGIYFWFNEDDISEMRLLINPPVPVAGASGATPTPYDGGFFLFEIKFPENFPMEPPKLTFNPKQNTARLHPNYYTCGKVCLSIINTWGDKQWASSVTMIALATTLGARMDENAITGEPGYENASEANKKRYNDYVEYGKYKEAIAVIVTRPPPLYAPFMDIIRANFARQYREYHKNRLEQLKEIKQLDGIPLYGRNVQCNYPAIIAKLEEAAAALA